MRSAESDRQASCAFADRVASTALVSYHRLRPGALTYAQTCVASILLHDNNDDCLEVVALGVGTKTLPATVLLAEQKRARVAGEGDRLVRDCHAEVLARRAFLCFLHEQLAAALQQRSQRYFERDRGTGLLRPRRGVTFHLYTSSQPCGNATIKRWGKGCRPPQFPDTSVLPSDAPHPRLYVTAPEQGQVALLVKRDGTLPPPPPVPPPRVPPPPGTAYADGPAAVCGGVVMSCSDKLALRNALGLGGARTPSQMPPPPHPPHITHHL